MFKNSRTAITAWWTCFIGYKIAAPETKAR